MKELLAASAMVLCLLPGVLLRYFPMKSILEKTVTKKLMIGYLLVFILAIFFLSIRFRTTGISMTTVRSDGTLVTLALAAVNLLLIRKRIREQVFLFGMVIVCNYLLLSIPEYAVQKLPPMSNLQEFYFYIFIYYILLAASFFPLLKMVKTTIEPFLHLDVPNYWNTLWFIPIALFAVLYLAYPLDRMDSDLLGLAGRILVAVVDIALCLSMAKDHKAMYEKLSISDQLARQKLHYIEMQTKVSDMRQNRHDMKHHIAAIRRYIEADDKSGLSRYCDDLVQRNQLDRTILPYTGNIAADGVVYEYMQLCEKHHVDFSCVGIVHSDRIADIDICVLIGNALDNALAACLTIPENRYIRLMSKTDNQDLIIMVTNNFDGNITRNAHGDILSRRRGDRPGMGMRSMKSVCQRYGGTMEQHWDEHTFTIMFTLPLPKDQ